MKRQTIYVLTTLILLIGTQSLAKEGFFLEEDLPPQLLPAWEATFLIHPTMTSEDARHSLCRR